MTRPLPPAHQPAALHALHTTPHLFNAVADSMQQQGALVRAAAARMTGRERTLADLAVIIDAHPQGGLVTLEGSPGSGVTTLLAHLAATRALPFWLRGADGGQGAAALAAQLIALYDLDVPLIPPAIQTDPTALAELLHDAAARTPDSAPLLVLLDDSAQPLEPTDPLPLVLPDELPPGVLVLYGCLPGAPLPLPPVAQIALPTAGNQLAHDQEHVLHALACPTDWYGPLLSAAQGNMLYLHLAVGMLKHGLLHLDALPVGLDNLHAAWWASLATPDLALLLAAAGEPIPLALCAALGINAQPTLTAWDEMGLTRHSSTATPASQQEPIATACWQHWATSAFIARTQPVALAACHTRLAALASSVLDLPAVPDLPAQPNTPVLRDQAAVQPYLARQFARHAALADETARHAYLPLVAQRTWVRAQERRPHGLASAARDLVWELRTAARTDVTEDIVRLVRSAALAGTLTNLARTLAADAAVAALHVAAERLGREPGLRRVRALVDDLPDMHDKATVLRQLGEASHALQMRTSAMRLLSQALDIEGQPFPLVWREQREQALAEFAAAALNLGAVDTALEIAASIGHIERRGMTQTQIVRWLLAQGQHAQARTVATQIAHESLAAWAQAEVAATLARAGDQAQAAALLDTVDSETARSWAEIELACDLAATDETTARQHIDALASPHQRDRGLAHLARALAYADKDGDALDAAAQISDTAVRVAALLDLRLMLEGLVAMLALEQAASVVGRLPRDVRVPLVALLAASYAALGKRDQAFAVAAQLAEGEERDRAFSRVAVATARAGDHAEALHLARSLNDDDERDWTLDELARAVADAHAWQLAHDVAREISAAPQQARTLADLAIAQARAGQPLAARDLALTISVRSEYVRALTLLVPALVAGGHTAAALALREAGGSPLPLTPTQHSRYLAALAMALAEHDALDAAEELIYEMRRPLDQGRTYLAIATAAAQHDRPRALRALGLALHQAVMGREVAFRLLNQAAPLLGQLGGAPLLLAAAGALNELDAW